MEITEKTIFSTIFSKSKKNQLNHLCAEIESFRKTEER